MSRELRIRVEGRKHNEVGPDGSTIDCYDQLDMTVLYSLFQESFMKARKAKRKGVADRFASQCGVDAATAELILAGAPCRIVDINTMVFTVPD